MKFLCPILQKVLHLTIDPVECITGISRINQSLPRKWYILDSKVMQTLTGDFSSVAASLTSMLKGKPCIRQNQTCKHSKFTELSEVLAVNDWVRWSKQP